MQHHQRTKHYRTEVIPYHVFSRATEGRSIFQTDDDSYRFIFQMYITNHGTPAPNLHRRDIMKAGQAILQGDEVPKSFFTKEHNPLVEFLSFTEVVNHYHFLLLTNIEHGIARYMQKLNTAFARYFNIKHTRRGRLFEAKYKIIPIQSEAQLDAIIRYINVKNPLDVYQPGWRENGLNDKEAAWEFLHRYLFSSFPDIFGKRNSKLIAQGPLRNQYLDRQAIYGEKSYIQFLQSAFHSSLPPDIALE